MSQQVFQSLSQSYSALFTTTSVMPLRKSLQGDKFIQQRLADKALFFKFRKNMKSKNTFFSTKEDTLGLTLYYCSEQNDKIDNSAKISLAEGKVIIEKLFNFNFLVNKLGLARAEYESLNLGEKKNSYISNLNRIISEASEVIKNRDKANDDFARGGHERHLELDFSYKLTSIGMTLGFIALISFLLTVMIGRAGNYSLLFIFIPLSLTYFFYKYDTKKQRLFENQILFNKRYAQINEIVNRNYLSFMYSRETYSLMHDDIFGKALYSTLAQIREVCYRNEIDYHDAEKMYLSQLTEFYNSSYGRWGEHIKKNKQIIDFHLPIFEAERAKALKKLEAKRKRQEKIDRAVGIIGEGVSSLFSASMSAAKEFKKTMSEEIEKNKIDNAERRTEND